MLAAARRRISVKLEDGFVGSRAVTETRVASLRLWPKHSHQLENKGLDQLIKCNQRITANEIRDLED